MIGGWVRSVPPVDRVRAAIGRGCTMAELRARLPDLPLGDVALSLDLLERRGELRDRGTLRDGMVRRVLAALAAVLLLSGCAVRYQTGYYVEGYEVWRPWYYAEPCGGQWCYRHPHTGRVVYVLPDRRGYVGSVPVYGGPVVRPAPKPAAGYTRGMPRHHAAPRRAPR